jgi:hypothetical protein
VVHRFERLQEYADETESEASLVGALDLKFDTLFAYYLFKIWVQRFGAHGVPVITFF